MKKLLGVLLIFIGMVFIYQSINLFYGYNFTDKLYFMMLSNWELALYFIGGLAGVFGGIKLIRHKTSK